MSGNYFEVKIENPDRDGVMPTYAVLGESDEGKSWGIEDTLQMIRDETFKPKYLFMVISDQQVPPWFDMGSDIDNLYGRKLTGAKRISNTKLWKGDYKIYRKIHDSTARSLYEKYGGFVLDDIKVRDGIIIDVLNPNNNWLYLEDRKDMVEKELRERVLERILRVYDKMDMDRPMLLFAGFGRGALLAYHLAVRMANESPKVVLVSIDPRVNDVLPGEKRLISGWFRKNHGKWIAVKNKPGGSQANYFPVLNPLPSRVHCYNVFQRHKFTDTALDKSAARPVGCAIDEADLLGVGGVNGFILKRGPKPYEQMDTHIKEHSTEMLDKYALMIKDVALNEGFTTTPELERLSPEGGVAGDVITITGRNLDGCGVIIKADNDIEADLVLTSSQVSVTADGRTLTFPCPGSWYPGVKNISLERNGEYSTSATFKVAPYISGVSRASQIVGKEVTLNGYFKGNWTLQVNGAGTSVMVDMSGDGDTVTFTVPKISIYGSPPHVGPVTLQALSEEGFMGTPFDFVIAPYIRSVSPASGAPGTNVVVHVDVGDGWETNTLSFCDIDIPLNLDELSHGDGTVEVQAPDITGGVYDVMIVCEDSDGNVIYSNTGQFTINAVIAAMSPAVQMNGRPVGVLGAGFGYKDDVLLNGVGAAAKMADEHTINFKVQTDVGKKEVVVVGRDGRRSNTVIYGIAPYIDASTSPASALPGSEVRLKGYFLEGVLFYRDAEIDSWVIDDNTLGFNLPEIVAGDGELKIKYDSDKVGNIVNFAVKPKITALSQLALSPGDVLTVTGIGFTDACRLHINGVEVAASYTSPDTFEWVVPDDAEPGPRYASVVDTTTGLAGNEMECGVTPYIKFLSTESESPGATIVAHGFFRSDDHIQMEGKEAVTEVEDELTLSFTMPLLRRGGRGDVVVVEGERRSNGAHCEVDFVAWPVMEARSGKGEEYHWLAAMDSECYHRADCWRVERMATEELLGFANREDAWLFGYEPCHCVKTGGEEVPEKALPAGYVAEAAHLKHSFDFPYYGNVKSRELHQDPCVRKVSDIPVASRIGFLDPEEAHTLGFDNCYYCLGDSKR